MHVTAEIKSLRSIGRVGLQFFTSFERVVTVHCLAALDLGAGVEQPFNCLIVQNRQPVRSIGDRSIGH